MRKSTFALAVVVACVLCHAIQAAAQQRPAPNLARWGEADPAHQQQVDDQIKTLQAETWEQTIDALKDSQWYFGYHDNRKGAQLNLETMLSSRRCQKVLDTIKQLPDEKRAAKATELFDAFLAVHSAAMQRAIDHAKDPGAPTNTQSLLATQLALCLAMFATAEAGDLKELARQFAVLSQLKKTTERELAERPDVFDPSFVATVRRYCVPDNRFQINCMRLAAAHMSDEDASLRKIDEVCTDLDRTRIPIVSWDARVSWFDFARVHEGAPIDESKGVTEYMFYDFPPGTGMQFDKEAQDRLVHDIQTVLGLGVERAKSDN
jgi:hypothetical protein